MPEELVPDIAERRSSYRFTLRLAITCKQLGRTVVGESLNISSKGLLFKAAEAFQPGQIVEASIDWPVLLDNCTRLKLVVEGPVVWNAGDDAAMRIDRYEFRTRAAPEWRSVPQVPVAGPDSPAIGS